MVADRAQHKPDQGTKKDDIETSPDANITLDSTTTSDIESGERPVREKLKKTSITPASANSKTPFKRDRTTQFVNNEIIPALSEDTGVDMNESLQLEDSKLERKRSHDDMESDDPEALDGDRRGSDPRKRSRESSMDGDANSNRLGRAARHSSASRSPSEEHGNSASVFTGVEGEDGTLQVKELSTAQDDTMTGRIDTEIDEEDAASEITGKSQDAQQLTTSKADDGLTSTSDCVGPEFIKSPKNKRSRDEYIRDNDRASLSQNASLSEVHVPVTKQEDKHAPTDRDQTVAEEPNPKRHRDSNSPQADDTNKPPTGTDTEVGY